MKRNAPGLLLHPRWRHATPARTAVRAGRVRAGRALRHAVHLASAGRRRRVPYAVVGAGLAITATLVASHLATRVDTPAPRVVQAVVLGVLLAVTGWWVGRREDNLRRLGAQDYLTGLWNRRYFDAQLDHALATHRRDGRNWAVLCLDLDALKEINDRGGHAAGDSALQAVGRALRNSVRASDVAARVGGDEFAVLVAGNAAAASALGIRLQRLLADEQGPHVSFGAADLNRHGASVVQAADCALYRHKQRLSVPAGGEGHCRAG